MDKTEGIGHRERPRQGGQYRNHPIEHHHIAQLQGLGKKHLFAQKPIQQGYSGHGSARHHGQQRGMRHVFAQPIQAAHIPRAGLVVNNAGGHKQRCLEGCVVHDMKQCGHRCQGRAQAKQQGDEPQMADGGIGQQAFEIVFEQRHIGAEYQSGQACQGDNVEPQLAARQSRIHTCQQEDSGLDHGGRMQISRNRCGCCHGVRQPKMEGKLRGFGKGAQQDQHQRDGIKRVLLNHFRGCQNGPQIEAANNMPQQQRTGQQGKPPRSGYRQRHACALACVTAVGPITNQ